MGTRKNNNTKIDLAPGLDPWDQQPRESSRQYVRFLRYRDLGRMRSLTTLNKALTESGDTLTYGTIRIQSCVYRWTERAQLYDLDQDAKDREQIVAARREMTLRHRKIAGALTTKALTALRNVGSMDPADIIRFLKLATDLEIRALGEPNQTITVTGPAGGPIQTEDLTNLSDEQRRNRLRDIVAELARRANINSTED